MGFQISNKLRAWHLHSMERLHHILKEQSPFLRTMPRVDFAIATHPLLTMCFKESNHGSRTGSGVGVCHNVGYLTYNKVARTSF